MANIPCHRYRTRAIRTTKEWTVKCKRAWKLTLTSWKL